MYSIQDFMAGFSLTGQRCTMCGEAATQRVFREITVGWEYRCGKHGLASFASQDVMDELATTRAQLAAMREKLALLDPVLRKLWALHGCIEGGERYQEIEREWAYAMELMDEMLPQEWAAEGEGQDGKH